MATFTEEDRKLLDQLKKAFENFSRSISSRQPWQEPLSRDNTIEESRSVLSAQVLDGLSGSWASMWSYGRGSSFQNPDFDSIDPNVPISIRERTSKLGQRGVPEINFVPYQYRTNQGGNKGPSLVGHPISFEIVGPTLKSPACDWMWQVTLGAGPNGGDLLTMSTRADGSPATCTTILQAYNLPNFTIGDVTEPNGGLYLLVTDDGQNPGSIEPALDPMNARTDRVDTARYEIFRVSNITESSIEIHPSKSFEDFFVLPLGEDRYVRAITLVKPYVTRLAAIPGSGLGKGREQTFFLVSPEKAASGDLYPPFDGGDPLDGTWLQGGFTLPGAPNSNGAVGVEETWLARPNLPIPRPIKEGQGAVFSDTLPISPVPVGEWLILTDAIDSGDVGRVINVINVNSSKVQENKPHDFAQGDPVSCLGWYEILEVIVGVPNAVLLLRLPEPNAETGRIYFGPGPYLDKVIGEELAQVSFTVHDPISDLWLGAFDMDKVNSSRLNHIIDPKYVERFQKSYSDVVSGFPKPALGLSSGKSDRAIFDTRKVTGGLIPEIYNPGNLMDLGFRMVLFPAKSLGGNIVPDYDRPILGRELIIDPAILEAQSITIDYAAGSVTLSHPPPIIPGGDIIPNGIIIEDNPRGEVVLFAACVPFSREESQTSAGFRVTTTALGHTQPLDSFSRPIEAFIDPNTSYAVSAPFIGPSLLAPFAVEIILDREWEGPETGVFDIISGGQIDYPSFGTWSYSQTRSVILPSGGRVTALGGITSLSNVSDPSVSISGSDERIIVLRREVFFGRRSENLSGVLENFREDVTYGSSARSSVLRFDKATQIRHLDGSTSIRVAHRNQLWQPYGTWVAASILTSGLPALAAEGVFAAPAYYVNGALTSDGIGTLSAGEEGQKYDIEVLPAPGNNYGISTNDIGIQTQQRFRLVSKFQVSGGGAVGTDSIYYIGLIGQPIGTILADAFASPINPATFYVGLRLEGDVENPIDLWQLIVQNPISPMTKTVNIFLAPDRTYFFILETEQDGRRDPVLSEIPTRLKISIQDQDLNVLFSTVIRWGSLELPFAVTSFNYFAGLEYVSGAGRRTLSLQMVSFVTRIDLPGPEFPS